MKLLLQCNCIPRLLPKAFVSANKQLKYLLFTVKLRFRLKVISCPYRSENFTKGINLLDKAAAVKWPRFTDPT